MSSRGSSAGRSLRCKPTPGARILKPPRAESGSRAGQQEAAAPRSWTFRATPRHGGGRTEPQQPSHEGERNREGVGNLVSGDKTLMESPERGRNAAGTGRAASKGNGKNNRKKRAA